MILLEWRYRKNKYFYRTYQPSQLFWGWYGACLRESMTNRLRLCGGIFQIFENFFNSQIEYEMRLLIGDYGNVEHGLL